MLLEFVDRRPVFRFLVNLQADLISVSGFFHSLAVNLHRLYRLFKFGVSALYFYFIADLKGAGKFYYGHTHLSVVVGYLAYFFHTPKVYCRN